MSYKEINDLLKEVRQDIIDRKPQAPAKGWSRLEKAIMQDSDLSQEERGRLVLLIPEYLEKVDSLPVRIATKLPIPSIEQLLMDKRYPRGHAW